MLKRKNATITIKRQEVIKKIESLAYKRVESSLSDATPETQSAVQADSAEGMDSTILYSLLNSRDTEIRSKLLYCLVADNDNLSVSNSSSNVSEYVYNLEVPEEFTRDQLLAACGLINDYFIYATLHDWYIQHGVSTTVDPTWLDSLLRKIAGAFRFETLRKPLQPFGVVEPNWI